MWWSLVQCLMMMLAVAAAQSRMLFLDDRSVASVDGAYERVVHRPTKLGRVLAPSEPWENFGIGLYNTVLQDGGELRLYYDCMSKHNGTFYRFVCFANSSDGVTWTKPNLGLYRFLNETATNIVWPPGTADEYLYLEPGTVWREGDDGGGGYRMIVSWQLPGKDYGIYVLASGDGLRFDVVSPNSVHGGSDTQNVVMRQGDGTYEVFVRIDDAVPAEHGDAVCAGNGLSGDIRRIGACLIEALDEWFGCDAPVSVFTFDAVDPVCLDVYTNSATMYHGHLLLFPSMYAKVAFGDGQGNDGLMEPRFAFRDDLGVIRYLDRRAWLPLGPFGCPQPPAPSLYPEGLAWCAKPATAHLDGSHFDMTQINVAVGLVERGNAVYVYYSGDGFSHGADGQTFLPLGPSGIGLATLRKDGFASLSTDTAFTLTTKHARVGPGASLRFNAQIDAGGSLRIGLVGQPRFTLNESFWYRGGHFNTAAAWQTNASISELVGQSVQVVVEVVYGDLYSVAIE